MAKSGGVIAALLVATVGVGGVYYYSQNRGIGDQPEQLAAAVPENALMVGYVTTDTKVWSKLQKFGTPETKQLIGQSLQKLQQDLVASEQIDFQKDLQPWLGNVMVAALPSKNPASNPQPLLVSKVKDKGGALNFFNKMKSKAKTPLQELDYKGTKIFVSGTGKKATFTTAMSDWLLVAQDRQTLERSIDTVSGAPSFSKKNGGQFFASSSLNLPNQVISFYGDYPKLIQAMQRVGSSTQMISAANFDRLNQIKSMAGGIGIDEKGLRMKAVVQTTDQAIKMTAAPGQILTNFPADTVLVSSGSGLKEAWAQTQKQLAAEPELQKSMAQIKQSFQQSTKLDLDKDVLSWMGGEYALAIVPVNKGALKEIGVGVSAAFESTDKNSTNRTLQGLKTLASANGAAATERQSSGQNITDLQVPFLGSEPVLSYGWRDARSMFISMGDLQIKEPLPQSKDFQEITASLPTSNLGYLYVNFDQALKLINTKLPPDQRPTILPPASLVMLSSLRGLGATTTQNGNTIQLEGLLVLKPTSWGRSEVQLRDGLAEGY